MNDREWDNNYHGNLFDQTPGAYAKGDIMQFNKKIDGTEKINKVKFINLSQNARYKIIVRTDNRTYDDNIEFTVDMPGFYTVNLSDYDIMLDTDNFEIEIKSLNDTYLILLIIVMILLFILIQRIFLQIV